MYTIFSIGLLDGSMTLVDNMRTNHILPCDVESPHGVPKVLFVADGICVARSSRVLRSSILMSSMLFMSAIKLTIAFIDLSKDSFTNVAILL